MFKAHFSAISSSILFVLYSSSALAFNDWDKPCFDGTCSYELPDEPSGRSGTLTISGFNTSIADLTTAGGWEIISCDPKTLEQDIRIVCRGIDISGRDADNDGCSHLFANGRGSSSDGKGTNATTALMTPVTPPIPAETVVNLGDNSISKDEDQRAIGKIVRLPEECGAQAFGHIANVWTHENQTVPPNISKRLAPLNRRTQNRHKVKGLTIDTQFHKSNRAQHGAVNFAIVGANLLGAKTSSNSGIASSRSSEHSEKARNYAQSMALNNGAGAVGGAIRGGTAAVGGTISDGAGGVGRALSDGVGAVGNAMTSEKNANNSVSAPLDISKTFTLLDKRIPCTDGSMLSGVDGSTITLTISGSKKMRVDVEAGINRAMNVDFVANGSLTDLTVDSFELNTTLSGDFNGSIIMSAGVGSSFDSGNINFIIAFLPMNGPGTWAMMNPFQINGQGKISSNVDTDMRIGMPYHIGDLQFNYQNGTKKSGTFNPGDTPLQLSAEPSAKATGKVQAYPIPSLNVTIDAFGGASKATVLTKLNASASVTLTGDVTSPNVQANVTRCEAKPSAEVVKHAIRGQGVIGAHYLEKRLLGMGDIAGVEKASEAIADPNFSPSLIPTPIEHSLRPSNSASTSAMSLNPIATGTSTLTSPKPSDSLPVKSFVVAWKWVRNW